MDVPWWQLGQACTAVSAKAAVRGGVPDIRCVHDRGRRPLRSQVVTPIVERPRIDSVVDGAIAREVGEVAMSLTLIGGDHGVRLTGKQDHQE